MYPDVRPDHWAYNDIIWARRLRLMVGDERGLFHPDDPISRAEIAAVSVRGVFRSVELSAALLAVAGIGLAIASRRRG